MDTKKIDSKIKKYLALAGGITTVVSGANAQVVYTDVNPDYLLSGNLSVYPLDLNNDASPDFMLMNLDTLINYVSTSSSNIVTYNINVDAATINPGASSNGWLQSNSYPAALAQGAMVGSSGSFESSNSSFGYPLAAVVQQSVLYNGVPVYNYSDTIGNFQMDQEAILGLRFKINNNIHYGWARIEYTSGGILSIKDYAYDATPNTAVIAGETGTGLVSVIENENIVQINNINNQLQVELPAGLSNAQLRLISISGQEMINKQLNSNLENISLNELAAGIYIANVLSNDEVTTKRIYVR